MDILMRQAEIVANYFNAVTTMSKNWSQLTEIISIASIAIIVVVGIIYAIHSQNANEVALHSTLRCQKRRYC